MFSAVQASAIIMQHVSYYKMDLMQKIFQAECYRLLIIIC